MESKPRGFWFSGTVQGDYPRCKVGWLLRYIVSDPGIAERALGPCPSPQQGSLVVVASLLCIFLEF